MTLEAYLPSLEDLWFRQALLADEATMAYNAAWGGTISFPEEAWAGWYARWLEVPGTERYYRYLRDGESGRFVGEIAYHFDEEQGVYLCDVIVLAKERGRGFGTRGLMLLCEAAKANGIEALYDSIAADNPSLKPFVKRGFSVVGRTDGAVLVKKDLSGPAGGQTDTGVNDQWKT